MLGSSGPWGSCSNASMCCSSSCKHLYTLHTSVASVRALSIFALSAVRKIYFMVPVAVHATLFCKWELTAHNAFSVLSSDPSTASQSSTGTHTERARLPGTTYYVVSTDFLHPLEPQAPLPAGYPANYANCLAVSHCVHSSLRPGQARCEQENWKKTQGVIGTANTFILS